MKEKEKRVIFVSENETGIVINEYSHVKNGVSTDRGEARIFADPKEAINTLAELKALIMGKEFTTKKTPVKELATKDGMVLDTEDISINFPGEKLLDKFLKSDKPVKRKVLSNDSKASIY